MALHHAQSASSSAGNTGEALAPREEEHRHLVKRHIAPPRSFGFLKDGRCYGWKKKKKRGRIRIHDAQVREDALKRGDSYFRATRWHNSPALVLERCINAAEQTVKGHPSDSLLPPYHVPN